MRQDAVGGGAHEQPAALGGSPSGPAGGTPGQLRAEALGRAHALRALAEEVERTSRDIAVCRDDPSWSGMAHDAFVVSLDRLAGEVRLAAGLLHDAHPAPGSAPGCPVTPR
ncbi:MULTISPECIES: hypothetical protein [Clavibacter]|uniref:Uncharacterized protein n=1 Tax=Clavibacter tessellarius TaxID=31965 RepID=A0A154V2V4_9MICO|nr:MULTISPECIES: hypothetical protein [Clavibacter]KZC95708.1 hypothetical protein AWH51_06540 [Clavibacter michiganensis subsp. tessellarius]MDA3804998.1 hypothetical protein [Clavibacter sp. CT19]